MEHPKYFFKVVAFLVIAIFTASNVKSLLAQDLRYPDVYGRVLEEKIDLPFVEIQKMGASHFARVAGVNAKLPLNEWINLGMKTRATISSIAPGSEQAKQKAEELARIADRKRFTKGDTDKDEFLSESEYVAMFMVFMRHADLNTDERLSVAEVQKQLELMEKVINSAAKTLNHVKRSESAKAEASLQEFKKYANEVKPNE